jgi:hypothetical protein
VPQRPRDPAHWDLIKRAAAAASVPVIANGDVFEHVDFDRIRLETVRIRSHPPQTQHKTSFLPRNGTRALFELRSSGTG